MARASTKDNKNIYFRLRDELGLSREKASELLETIPPERIERIENEKALAHPDEILVMDAGAIVERGTHRELLTRRGVYYDLYSAQFQDA